MRLFVAVSLTDVQRAALLTYQRALKKSAADAPVNWSREENLHLTLAFIGEYPDPAPVIRALEGVHASSYALTLDGAGQFGDVRWVGVSDGGGTVRLAGEVRRALKAAGIPFDPKPVKPHITVARKFRGEASAVLPEPVRGEITAFSLMRSDRIDGRLRYAKIWETKLDPPSAG
ncbi:MAG: RNA 2',3'-cyclic phosphodiesterase [Clostridiales bacterium]|nr:RNA 2',3'-cyclic phosphodiesterase [Clostridiales bacterium]